MSYKHILPPFTHKAEDIPGCTFGATGGVFRKKIGPLKHQRPISARLTPGDAAASLGRRARERSSQAHIKEERK